MSCRDGQGPSHVHGLICQPKELAVYGHRWKTTEGFWAGMCQCRILRFYGPLWWSMKNGSDRQE